jgi:hypothetical protein
MGATMHVMCADSTLNGMLLPSQQCAHLMAEWAKQNWVVVSFSSSKNWFGVAKYSHISEYSWPAVVYHGI